MASEPKSAAEWLETERVDPSRVIQTPNYRVLWAMLRDAKAELEFFDRWRRDVMNQAVSAARSQTGRAKCLQSLMCRFDSGRSPHHSVA